MAESDADVVTVGEAALIASVPYTTVSRWLAVGAYGMRLDHTRFGHAQVIRRGDLTTFLEHYQSHRDKRSARSAVDG